MKRKLMMLIATVVMVAGLTACGDGGASDTNTKPIDTTLGIENGEAVVEETTPVDEAPVVEDTSSADTIPVIEDKPAFTTFECRDYEVFVGPNVDVLVVDGVPVNPEDKIADIAFRIPENHELTWEDIMSVEEKIHTHHGQSSSIFLKYTQCPGDDMWFEEFGGYLDFYYQSLKWLGIEDAETNSFYDITLSDEEFQNLYVEFITNYSIVDFNRLYGLKGCEASKGESMSEEAKKFLPISAIIVGSYFDDIYLDEVELYKTNPEKFELVVSNK